MKLPLSIVSYLWNALDVIEYVKHYEYRFQYLLCCSAFCWLFVCGCGHEGWGGVGSGLQKFRNFALELAHFSVSLF